jgi:hypothetical protein
MIHQQDQTPECVFGLLPPSERKTRSEQRRSRSPQRRGDSREPRHITGAASAGADHLHDSRHVTLANLLRGVNSTMGHTAHVDDGEKRTLEASTGSSTRSEYRTRTGRSTLLRLPRERRSGQRPERGSTPAGPASAARPCPPRARMPRSRRRSSVATRSSSPRRVRAPRRAPHTGLGGREVLAHAPRD